jgi:hypothetical protein
MAAERRGRESAVNLLRRDLGRAIMGRHHKGRRMRTIGLVFGLAMIFAVMPEGPSQAASYGCNVEKCIAACQKVGGRVRLCPKYCEGEIAKDPKCNKR